MSAICEFSRRRRDTKDVLNRARSFYTTEEQIHELFSK